MSGNRNAHTKLLFVSIGLMMLMNGSCSRSSRLSTCAEIRSAAEAMKGGDAFSAVESLRKYAHSPDSFVRTQVVMVASDLGPTLEEPLRNRCMTIVGEAISDPSGYVLHASLQGIGNYESSAQQYIDHLLAISARQDYPNSLFALESLARIGPGRRDVGDRLVEAIFEEGSDLRGTGFPCRYTALEALRSWGDHACPWLPDLKQVLSSWQRARSERPPIPAEQRDGPAQWARQHEDVEFNMLVDIIENLENTCVAGGTGQDKMSQQ